MSSIDGRKQECRGLASASSHSISKGEVACASSTSRVGCKGNKSSQSKKLYAFGEFCSYTGGLHLQPNGRQLPDCRGFLCVSPETLPGRPGKSFSDISAKRLFLHSSHHLICLALIIRNTLITYNDLPILPEPWTLLRLSRITADCDERQRSSRRSSRIFRLESGRRRP
jgi:hypothetical protein